MKLVKIIFHIIFILLLTVLTQVGGLIWIVTIIISIILKYKKRYLFIGLYFLFNLLVVPPIAKVFGREKLPVFGSNLASKNFMYPILFRNYVNSDLKNLLLDTSEKIATERNFKITYLDANFPFYDGFPLVPHLSHNDGKKIDISFMYKTKDGKELKALEAAPDDKDPAFSHQDQIKKLKKDIQDLKNRVKKIPWIDEFDLKFNQHIKQPIPTTSAVMFCLMDVSGSMSQMHKDIAKRFFILLYMFLRRNYQKIDVVFIRHHTSAKEVDEEEFFTLAKQAAQSYRVP